MRPLALKWRVSILVTAAMIAVTAIVLAVSYVESAELSYRQLDRTLAAMGQGTISVFDTPEVSDDDRAAIRSIMGVSGRKELPFYRVWTGADNELCSDRIDGRVRVPEILANVVPPRVGSSVLFDVRVGRDRFRAIWLKQNAAPGLMNVVVGLPTAEIEAELHDLLSTLLIVGGVIVVCVVGLMMLLVAWGLRPLQTTAARVSQVTARNVGEVDLDRRKAPTEVQPFVDAVSDMLSRLHQAMQQQKVFVADASHELRTPIALAKSTIQLALSKERTSPEYRSALNDALDDLNRMEHLTEELLVLARLDESREPPIREPVDLAALLEELCEIFRTRVAQAAGRLELNVVPATVRGDAGRLTRLFSNILDNALKYGPRAGTVRVSLRMEQARTAVVAVQDEGGNIPAEALPHLFERFYRADPSRSHATGGAGLGLAIAYEIAIRHGGEIAITSNPASGTIVTVRLPAE